MKTKEEADVDRVHICDNLYKIHKKLPIDASIRSTTEMQWREILTRTLGGLLPQIKEGDEVSIGIAHETDLTVRDYANMTVSAIKILRAQGDLSIPNIPNLEAFLRKWRISGV